MGYRTSSVMPDNEDELAVRLFRKCQLNAKHANLGFARGMPEVVSERVTNSLQIFQEVDRMLDHANPHETIRTMATLLQWFIRQCEKIIEQPAHDDVPIWVGEMDRPLQDLVEAFVGKSKQGGSL